MKRRTKKEVEAVSSLFDDWSYDNKIGKIETRGDGLFSFGGTVVSRSEIVERLKEIQGDHSAYLPGFGRCMVTGFLLSFLLDSTRTPGVPFSIRVRKRVAEPFPAANSLKPCSTYFKNDVRGFSGLSQRSSDAAADL